MTRLRLFSLAAFTALRSIPVSTRAWYLVAVLQDERTVLVVQNRHAGIKRSLHDPPPLFLMMQTKYIQDEGGWSSTACPSQMPAMTVHKNQRDKVACNTPLYTCPCTHCFHCPTSLAMGRARNLVMREIHYTLSLCAMCQLTPRYWVNSSHNSYLQAVELAPIQGFYHAVRFAAAQGNQLTSTSSALAISSLLRNGCRVVELDVPH